MLQPKRTKYRKQQKGSQGKITGLAHTGNKVSFGSYGLKGLECGRITARQIESARRVISRYIKRAGKVWIRIFPDKPITKKPLEVRQGKGKGSVELWVAIVRPGTILFEMEGVSKEVAKEAFRLAKAKLPIKAEFVEKEIM
jgi:large subunit ribosomal protein L16